MVAVGSCREHDPVAYKEEGDVLVYGWLSLLSTSVCWSMLLLASMHWPMLKKMRVMLWIVMKTNKSNEVAGVELQLSKVAGVVTTAKDEERFMGAEDKEWITLEEMMMTTIPVKNGIVVACWRRMALKGM